ncbi:hypothetical protein D3C86_1827880 [compost metagenome]
MDQQRPIEAELVGGGAEAAPGEVDRHGEKHHRRHHVHALGHLPALASALQLVGRGVLVAIEVLLGHQRPRPGMGCAGADNS